MYSLRLVTPMGKYDVKHKEAFDRYKSKVRYDNKFCPSCKYLLDHIFFLFHDNTDALMCRIDFFCKNCSYSKRFFRNYSEITSIV